MQISAIKSQTTPGGVHVIVDKSAHPGDVFFVHSGTGAATGISGRDPTKPFSTLAGAVAVCTADKGDAIIILPGHTETLAASTAIATAGIGIYGLGRGTLRPTFTMSATGSKLLLNAANIMIRNCLFLATADCTIVIDVDKTDCHIDRCEIRATTGKEFVTGIDVNGGAANACDRTLITNCIINSELAAGASCGIGLDEVAAFVKIIGCQIVGDFGDACIHNVTGKVLTNLLVLDCYLKNDQTGDHSIELVSACTGALVRNIYHNDMTQATGQDTGSCFSFENYHCDAIDVSGILSPAAT